MHGDPPNYRDWCPRGPKRAGSILEVSVQSTPKARIFSVSDNACPISCEQVSGLYSETRIYNGNFFPFRDRVPVTSVITSL